MIYSDQAGLLCGAGTYGNLHLHVSSNLDSLAEKLLKFGFLQIKVEESKVSCDAVTIDQSVLLCRTFVCCVR